MENNSKFNLENQVKFACVQAVLSDILSKKLYGEILTIFDCVVNDLESRKAAKSLASQAFTRNSKRILTELNVLSVEQNKIIIKGG